MPTSPPPEGGFRVLGGRTVARLAFLALERIHLLDPDGNAMVRVAVRHPGAVAVVPLIGDDVVLLEQYRAPVERSLLEIPAGKLDDGVGDLEATARRELEEEVGLRAERIERLLDTWTTPGFSDERITIFAAFDPVPVDQRPHGVEETHARVVRMPLRDALTAIDTGRITDAKTIIGLLVAARRR